MFALRFDSRNVKGFDSRLCAFLHGDFTLS
jgi:hypothetical protein